MSFYYYSAVDGNDANDGSSWAQAKATINAALGLCSAGDIVKADSAGNENNGASFTITGPSVVRDKPVLVISVDRSASDVYQAGAVIRCANAGADLTIGGSSQGLTFVGVTLSCADRMQFSSDTIVWLIECTLIFDDWVYFVSDGRRYLLNCSFEPTSASARLYTTGPPDNNVIIGGAFAGTALTGYVFYTLADGAGFRVRGLDLSACGAGVDLWLHWDNAAVIGQRLELDNVVLPASWSGTVFSSTPTVPVIDYIAKNTGPAAVDVEGYIEHRKLRGTMVPDTSKYLSAESLGFAHKLSVSGTYVNYFFPFEVLLAEFYAAANPTVRIELMSDTSPSSPSFTDLECSIRVEFPSDATNTGEITGVDTLGADPHLNSGTELTTSTAYGGSDWTGEISPGTAKYYKIEKTVSGGQAGVHRVFFRYRPSSIKNLWLHPVVFVS